MSFEPEYGTGSPAGPPDPLAAPPSAVRAPLPPDLQVPWSWGHFVVFLFFGFASFVVVQITAGVLIFRAVKHPLTQKQLQQFLEAHPQFLVATNVVWFAFILLFLYVTVAALQEVPFWPSVGWRRLRAFASGRMPSAWTFFLGGVLLSLVVAGLGSRIRTPDNMPIQDLFKSRTGTILLMSMAVFVAPLVEETVFRGYLYPLLAKSFGVAPGVLVTGVLFGLMHGAQLGWTPGLVAMLVFVGIVFTWVRAKTGTVFASFLMHLGYNTAIAVSSIIVTHGFTRLPPVH